MKVDQERIGKRKAREGKCFLEVFSIFCVFLRFGVLEGREKIKGVGWLPLFDFEGKRNGQRGHSYNYKVIIITSLHVFGRTISAQVGALMLSHEICVYTNSPLSSCHVIT